jgi:hypothetical protein
LRKEHKNELNGSYSSPLTIRVDKNEENKIDRTHCMYRIED